MSVGEHPTHKSVCIISYGQILIPVNTLPALSPERSKGADITLLKAIWIYFIIIYTGLV